MNKFKIAIARNLTRLMKEHPVVKGNDNEMYRQSGVSQATITRLKNEGVDNPKLHTLATIAKFFHITIDQLIGIAPLFSGINEKTNHYQKFMEIKRIPIIHLNPENITNVLSSTYQHKGELMNILFDAGERSFAIKTDDNRYSSLISNETTIVFDPDAPLEFNKFVLVSFPEDSDYYIMQYIKMAGEIYLKPIGESIPPISLSLSSATIHAKAVKMITEKDL